MPYGVNERFDFGEPTRPAAALGRVHFIAIGGSGMSGVAAFLSDLGVTVSGCDGAESPAVERLRADGIAVAVGHDPAHLVGVDTVIVSSAIPESNAELAAARADGRVVLHRAQALASAMGDDTRVAVAGANGKTTTSAMIVSALRAAGAHPSFAIGSELVDLGRNSLRGSGQVFVAEADESDGSFLSYRPHIAVVTNVQPDHLDFYGDVAHVEAAYAAFARSVEPGGVLVAFADDAGSARLASAMRAGGRRVITYGEAPEADVRITDVAVAGLTSRAIVTYDGMPLDLTVAAPGRHNLVNAVAALSVGWAGLGLDPVALAAGLAAFPGTRRRFERRGSAAGVDVVDDYAHNAPKVAAVVAGARAVVAPGASVRVVFQPHLYSRTRDFAPGFAAGLAGADQVVLLPVYGAREQPVPGVDSHLIAAELAALGGEAELAADPADAVRRLVAKAAAGDLVLTVGAGDVTRLAPLILAALDGGRE